MIEYDPQDFWRVLFARYGSNIPKVLPRTLLVLPVSIGIALLHHYDQLGDTEGLHSVIMPPFTTILGLLMAFRAGDAFRKWQHADQIMLRLHSGSRTAIAKMCAYLPRDEEEALVEVRRLLVLAVTLIKPASIDTQLPDHAVNY